MTTEQGSWLSTRLVAGLMVVAVGLAFMFDNLGWMDAGQLIRYWPFGIIAIGVVKLVQAQSWSGRILGGIICAVGAMLAADVVFVVHLNVFRWWPVAIIIFGVMIVLKAFHPSDADVRVVSNPAPGALGGSTFGASGEYQPPASHLRPGSMQQKMSEFAVWSGVERRVSSPAFKRADLTAVMGGIEFDLRQAGTDQGEAVIEVFVLWGGIEITVPPDWAVSNEVVAIMGGAEDQSTGTQQAKHRLIVKGVVIMGGVDIKT
jgi:predicted membrane protein